MAIYVPVLPDKSALGHLTYVLCYYLNFTVAHNTMLKVRMSIPQCMFRRIITSFSGDQGYTVDKTHPMLIITLHIKWTSECVFVGLYYEQKLLLHSVSGSCSVYGG